MGTRSNFYKNPSITYNKHFSLSSVLQNLQGLFPISLLIPSLSLSHQFPNLQLITSSPATLLPTTNRIPLPPPPSNVAAIPSHRSPVTITLRMTLKMSLPLCPTAITFKREGKINVYAICNLRRLFLFVAFCVFEIENKLLLIRKEVDSSKNSERVELTEDVLVISVARNWIVLSYFLSLLLCHSFSCFAFSVPGKP